jgi:hypothetical protein
VIDGTLTLLAMVVLKSPPTTIGRRSDLARPGRALGGENNSDTRIGGRLLGAGNRPNLRSYKRISDAAANLAVCGPRAVGAVFFKSSAR